MLPDVNLGASLASTPKLSVLDAIAGIPRPHVLLYGGMLLAAIVVGKAFDVTLSHVVFLMVAGLGIVLHHTQHAQSTLSDYDKIVTMWRDLPGPTTAFFLDANLIIFFYQMKDVGRSHESGWAESIRQVNELLRRVQESEWVTEGQDAFYRASHMVYQRALFHFQSLGLTQSEYVQYYERWQQAMPQLQSLLWYHLETIRKNCQVPAEFATDIAMHDPVLSAHTVPF
jgi:hypothetical protein